MPRRRPVSFRTLSFALAALVALGLGVRAFYSSTQAEASNTNAAAMPPAPSVDVITLQPKSLRLWNEFSGRLEAVDYVQVRPRVSGTIQKVLFTEGAVVKAGDPLFLIDPRPFEAEVASAKADLASAESQAQLAQVQFERAETLLKEGHTTRSIHDERSNARKVALAAIDAAKARLRQAKLNLEYAHIAAPVSGRAGRAELTEGNVVQAGMNAPVLTTIVSNDKIYADFDVDEQTYLRSIRASGTPENSGKNKTLPVELTLSGGDTVTYQGVIHAFDNQLDTSSGTIRARAIFDNKDGALVPGMYATVRVGSAEQAEALLLPERAIGTDQNRKFVYVVDDAGKVVYREVTLGQAVEGHRVALAGVQAGDRVMVNSLQRVRPEMQVVPVDVSQTPDTVETGAHQLEKIVSDGATAETPAGETPAADASLENPAAAKE